MKITNAKIRSFTLLEVLLALLLLSMLFTVTALTMPAWLEKSRVDHALNKICARIEWAEAIALSYQANLDLILREDPEKGFVLEFQAPWIEKSPFLQKAGRPLTIEGVRQIAFNGKIISELTLQFRPREGLATAGRLTIMGKKSSQNLNLLSKYETQTALYSP